MRLTNGSSGAHLDPLTMRQPQSGSSMRCFTHRLGTSVFAFCTSVVMGRDALDALSQQITRRRMADIAQAEDADHSFILVYHR